MIFNKTFLNIRRSIRNSLRDFLAPDPAGLKDMTPKEQQAYVSRLRVAKRAQVEQWRSDS